jgi:hypothetical protein
MSHAFDPAAVFVFPAQRNQIAFVVSSDAMPHDATYRPHFSKEGTPASVVKRRTERLLSSL